MFVAQEDAEPTAGDRERASGPATRRSHATASCMPAPIAGPWIAAITGAG